MFDSWSNDYIPIAVVGDSIDVGGIENPAIELNEDDMMSKSLELEDEKYRRNKNNMKWTV